LYLRSSSYAFVEKFNFEETVYMGDGFYDGSIFGIPSIRHCLFAQARKEARNAADFINSEYGGEGAVMDACLYILDLA
jgi:3-deoxy-D-manno-octulosonate 8-phosphate phosphatase KdsC-like HAD superfamily phosphatase